jgi:hypothetical protein
MDYTFVCNHRFIAYKKSGSSAKNVNVAVREHCGGNSQITILDANHNVVSRTQFSSPGGVVTLGVAPNHEVEVFCDGGTDPHGCVVEISF